MKINLREAGRLRREIEGWLNKNTPDPVQEISIHDPNPSATLKEKRGDVLEQFEHHQLVLESYYQLRRRVGEANSESGIDALLADQAQTQRALTVLERLTDGDPPGHEVIIEEVAAEKAKDLRSEGRSHSTLRRRPSFFGGASEDSYNVLLDEDVERWRDEAALLRRRLREIQDKLIRLNLDTEIELDDNAAAELKARGLL